MVSISVKKLNDLTISCNTRLEGVGEDLVTESYYAISGLLKALAEEDEMMRFALVKMLAEHPEWILDTHADGFADDDDLSLSALLGRKAMEGGMN